MQDRKEQIKNNKKIIKLALAKTIKELRGEKSQFLFGSENDISVDIISKCERGLKDPQLTTLYKIAEAFDLTFPAFAAELDKNLPCHVSLIDK